MGALNSFKLGMQLSDAADTRRRQAQQDAWVNEERGQKRAEWQRAEAERTALAQANQELMTSLESPGVNQAAPFLETYGLRPQGQAVPVGGDGVGPQQFVTPQYNNQSPEFQSLRRLGKLGVGSRQDLAAMENAARAARLQQETSMVAQRVMTASPEELASFSKSFTDFKGVNGEMTVDPKTNMTTLKVGNKKLDLNRTETAQYVSALYKLHRGDQSGLADMAAIDKDLASSAASDFARMAEVTRVNNGAMEANNRIRNDNIRTGNDTARLGREQNAFKQKIDTLQSSLGRNLTDVEIKALAGLPAEQGDSYKLHATDDGVIFTDRSGRPVGRHDKEMGMVPFGAYDPRSDKNAMAQAQRAGVSLVSGVVGGRPTWLYVNRDGEQFTDLESALAPPAPDFREGRGVKPPSTPSAPQAPVSAFEQRKGLALAQERLRAEQLAAQQAAIYEEERKRLLANRPDLARLGGQHFYK